MRLLYIGDIHCSSGFGRVSHELLSRLATTWDLHVIGINFRGDDHHNCPWRCYPAALGGDGWGISRYPELATRLRPDITLALADPWVLTHYLRVKQTPEPLTAYIPIDGLHVAQAARLNGLALGIFYTLFGAQEAHQGGYTGQSTVIPHGVDLDRYQPHPRDEARARLKAPVDPGAYIVGCVNRNQPRKRLDLTIEAFARWVQRDQREDAYLWLHTPLDDVGWDLEDLCQYYGVFDRLIVSNRAMTSFTGIPEVEMPWLYSAFDVLLSTSDGEGWGLCVAPETAIQVWGGGVKTMAQIIPGDRVLAGDGAWHRVVRKLTRVDDTCRVQVQGAPALQVTPEHPFLRLPWRSAPVDYYRRHPDEGLAWVKAAQLRVGDFVALPRPDWRQPLPPALDIATFMTDQAICCDESFVWCAMGYSPRQRDWSIQTIAQRYQVSRRVAEDARNLLIAGRTTTRQGPQAQRLAQAMRREGAQVDPRPLRLPRHLILDARCLEFLGWYLAEGSCGANGKIEIDLHRRERPIAEHLAAYVEEALGLKPLISHPGRQKCRLTVYSTILASLLDQLCGHGARHKRLHPLLWQSAPALGPLLRGYFLGDGYQARGRYILSTASETLAWQCRGILATMGIYAALAPYTRRGLPGWSLSIGGDAAQRFHDWTHLPMTWQQVRRRAITVLVTDRYLFVRVRALDPGVVMPVMDIQVEGSHEFVGNGILLHNTTMEAMACGIPVIAGEWAALGEWAQPAAYLVPCTTTMARTAQVNVIGGIPDLGALVNGLDHLYSDGLLRQELGWRGQALVAQPQYRWEAIAQRFDEALRAVVASGEKEPTPCPANLASMRMGSP